MLRPQPRDLNLTSDKCQMTHILEAQEFPAYGSSFPWDMSFVTRQPRGDKMGTGQDSPLFPTQCLPPRDDTQDKMWKGSSSLR